MTPEGFVALEALYARVARIAGDMGGTTVRDSSSTLQVDMPEGLAVAFTPSNPPTFRQTLLVKAVRIYRGGLESDWQFLLGAGGWRGRQTHLSDDEIRSCLTPDGLPPARY